MTVKSSVAWNNQVNEWNFVNNVNFLAFFFFFVHALATKEKEQEEEKDERKINKRKWLRAKLKQIFTTKNPRNKKEYKR